ncbi:hypothetical protein Esti_001686 [Eimeria stiedai]
MDTPADQRRISRLEREERGAGRGAIGLVRGSFPSSLHRCLLRFLFFFCLLDISGLATSKEQRGGLLAESHSFAASGKLPSAASPSSPLLLLRRGVHVQQREFLKVQNLGDQLLAEVSLPAEASALLETDSQLTLHPMDRAFILYMCLGFFMCMLVLLLFVTLMCVLGER